MAALLTLKSNSPSSPNCSSTSATALRTENTFVEVDGDEVRAGGRKSRIYSFDYGKGAAFITGEGEDDGWVAVAVGNSEGNDKDSSNRDAAGDGTSDED